jgi:hypothetical protein
LAPRCDGLIPFDVHLRPDSPSDNMRELVASRSRETKFEPTITLTCILFIAMKIAHHRIVHLVISIGYADDFAAC